MVDDGILQRLIRKALSNGGEYADIFIEQRRSSAVQLEDDKIEKVITGTVAGIGIRLIYNGRTVYAFSNDFTEDTLMDLAGTVSKAAAGSEKYGVIDMKKRLPETKFLIKIPPDTVAMSKKIDLVRSGNNAARRFDNKIKQVTVIYRDSFQKIKVFTSEGYIAEDERVHTLGMAHVIAVDGDVIQTGYEPVGGLIGYELFDNNPLDAVALKAAARAVIMLKAGRAPGGRMPVVIASEAGGTMIHEAIGHGLEADLAQQGLSVYSKKIGQPAASPAITVIDDATLPNRRGSFSFDDEGTPSGRNVLVKYGILMGYMYDKYTAMVDGVASTGNGRRESYEHKPVPRMTNTFIAPGTLLPEDVVKSVHRGLLVKKMGGGQVNTVTGDFVFDVQEGYLIDNGGIGELVRGATLIGNGPEVLKSIDMVASDLGFSIGTCGKDGQGVPVSDALPTLRIPEMTVGGEVNS
ncbi:MAG: peptidase C69 [Nitrospirae bacterium GWC2_46_6]|nr:MAG: peptidase C69 [Nitrospirae bacterium GWA2_46_11]OGW23479.1 MAG: peptidase C69 [Nitrospirae bacterium GWC2_46_6]OGW26090.1 MAG: peptidase C69 [Nitrospirae bacterium GWB2_47_37]HAK89457.1 peptidase C69 [Nitrospiraceae bacterium]HCL81935.1 peptidase C69 [Nitrospiraceae bacterium]